MTTTAKTPEVPGQATSPRERRHVLLSPPCIRAVFIVAVLVTLEVLTRAGIIAPLILPPPSEILEAAAESLATSDFWSDALRSGATVLIAFSGGLVVGVLLGVATASSALLRRVLEPYLISLYATPTVVFYPLLLVVLGLGVLPIAVIASSMAAIPIVLSVSAALRAIPATLPRLGRSLGCSRWRLYRQIILPAALPLAMPGLRLGFIYTLIGTVAMEFILADSGLGYRIGFNYRSFEPVDMWAGIVVVSILAVGAGALATFAEGKIRRDMQ
jgi:NitT/TauT family transport system permease protein